MKLIDLRTHPNVYFHPVDTCATALTIVNHELNGAVLGQYALAAESDNGLYISRDPLGCNKLFYGWREDGSLVISNRLDNALSAGIDLDQLASCPPGYRLRLQDGVASVVNKEVLSSRRPKTDFDLATFKRTVREALDASFDHLAATYPAHEVVVCLSGGLDSSVIAGLAASRWRRVTAASFTYLSTADLRAWLEGAPVASLRDASEDFRSAAQVAAALGIPFLPVIRAPESVLAATPRAIQLCQDWRDFNVHCAIVNLFLAESIRAHFPGRDVLVLTGDLMNEFVCDYHEEQIEQTTYYPQPRIPIVERRRFFIRGLDVGDREIGVFSAFGLTLCQPFAAVADLYMTVPGGVLDLPDAKMALNGHLLHPAVSEAVNRTKQRAQVGGKEGGTLGIFHRAKLTQAALARLWAESLPKERRGERPHDIIQFGRYRSTRVTEGVG